MKLFLACIWGDVEPVVLGPFGTEAERTAAAKKWREEEAAEPWDGIFALNIQDNGIPEMWPYSVDDEDEDPEPDVETAQRLNQPDE